MAPSNEPELHMNQIPRGLGKEETGYFQSPFEYCQGACRTTSRSTQHENAFISPRRFCFGGNGRPYTPTPRVPPLPKGVKAVVGAAGASCNTVCKDQNLICNSDHFAALNDCNTLRSVFMCEAGCGPSEYNKREFPGYVVEAAQRQDWPAFCFFYFDSRKAVAGLTQHYNCSASSQHVQRVCPCESAPGLASQAGQVDALLSKQQQGKNGDSSTNAAAESGRNGIEGQGKEDIAGADSLDSNISGDSNDTQQQFELDDLNSGGGGDGEEERR